MAVSRWSAQQLAIGLAGALGILALALVLWPSVHKDAALSLGLLAVAAIVPAAAYLAWNTDPAWLLCLGLVLASVSGRWNGLGLPHSVTPDRFVIGVAMLMALVHLVKDARGASRFKLRAVHVVLAITVVYALISAGAAGTITNRESMFRMFDRLGVVPFAAFFLAPLIFRRREHRDMLLIALVAFGAYLGLMAFFQIVGPKALVFPRYIVDPTIGAHIDRARGPFAEAVTNGFALYGCGVAAVVAFVMWSDRRARIAAAAVAGLCALGVLLTLTRSVWIGAVLGSLLVLLAARETRRFVIPAIVAGIAAVLLAFAVVPGLYAKAKDRTESKRPVWDRENLDRAAVNMIAQKPLTGYGWDRFGTDSPEHFELSNTAPLTTTADTALHNAFLSNGVELGLLGTALWAFAMLLGIGGAIVARGPPELRPWQLGLAAVAICWLVIANFVNPLAFAPLLLWIWAGAVWAGYDQAQAASRSAGAAALPAAAS